MGSADLLEQLLGQESDSSNSAPQRRPDTAGEDLHADSAEHPIAIVGQQMARVQKFLRRRETSAPTQQLQARIVRDLDALIAAAEQQAGRASSQPSQNRSDAEANQPRTFIYHPPRPSKNLFFDFSAISKPIWTT